MGYTYVDLIFGITVAVSAGLILLLIKCIFGKFYEWLKNIRELSNEVMKDREMIKELEEEMMKDREMIKELEKELSEMEQS